MPEHSDAYIVGRLIERVRLLIAISDEIEPADRPAQDGPPRSNRTASPCPHPANARPSGASRSKTPDQNSFTTSTRNAQEPLDIPLLTLVIW